MSKLWIYIKTNLRANLKQFPIILVMYVGLPILFSLLMGFSFSSAFIPEESGDPIELSLVNEDQGEYGNLLDDTLRSEAMSHYIDVVEEDAEVNFNLLIEEDYSENLMDTRLVLDTKENASQSEETILLQIMTDFQESLVNQLELTKSIETIENNPEGMNELADSIELSAEVSSDQLFEKQHYESQTALTSNQFTSVSGLIYIFLLSLGGSVGIKTKEEMKGLRKRITILPLSPGQEIVYSIVSDSVLYIMLGSIYMIIWRLIDSNTFVGNPFFYLGWLIIYVFIVQVINSILYHAVPDKFISVIYQIITFSYMVFGFLPLDRIVGSQLSGFFSENLLRKIFNQPMYDYMTNQHFTDHIGLAISLTTIGSVTAILLIIWKTRKELKPV